MNNIPTVTFQILGPIEGAAEGSHRGLWFKIQSSPPPSENLVVGLKVCNRLTEKLGSRVR